MTILGLVLDLLLITMLGVMIYYVMRLHNRLEVIRSGRNDLESLLRDLVTSTAQAERSLYDLRENAGALNDTLQKQVTGAGRAREELEYLLAAADKTADTLMERISTARGTTAEAPAARPRAVEPKLDVPARTAPAAPKTETPAVPALQAVQPTGAPTAANRDAAESDLLRAIEKLR